MGKFGPKLLVMKGLYVGEWDVLAGSKKIGKLLKKKTKKMWTKFSRHLSDMPD